MNVRESVNYNWKVVVDAFSEGYHVDSIHPLPGGATTRTLLQQATRETWTRKGLDVSGLSDAQMSDNHAWLGAFRVAAAECAGLVQLPPASVQTFSPTAPLLANAIENCVGDPLDRAALHQASNRLVSGPMRATRGASFSVSTP